MGECTYERVYKENGEMQKRVTESIIEAAVIFRRKKIKRILDLGCGTGRNLVYLKNKGFMVTGCDVSAEALRISKRKVKKGSFAHCHMSSLPFHDGYFEGIVCNHVLQHGTISEIKKAIKEMYRVLKKDGILLLEVASIKSSKYKNGQEIELRTKINVGGFDGHIPHHFFTKTELQSMFKKFKIIRLSHKTHPSELNPEIMSATWKMYARK